MADRFRPGPGTPPDWSDAVLEDALRDLAGRIDYPEAPDLARSVRYRLAAESGATRRPGWREMLTGWFAGPSPRRAVAVAALALVVLGAAVLAAFPGARDTVAGWFGVRGIRITFVEDTPTAAPTPSAPATAGASPTPAPLGSNLLFGERVTLDEAQARVDYPLRVPDPALLGPPDEVYFRTIPEPQGVMVSFVYYPRPKLPVAAETGVGLLIVQFEAPEDSFFLEKGVAPANESQVVDVDGEDALWLGGAHYLLIAPDPMLEGNVDDGPAARTATNVLLWDEDGVTYRIEAEISQAEAIALAEGMTPISTPVPPTPTPAP